MSLRSPPSLLGLALLGAGCHEHSSGPIVSAGIRATNLGLALGPVLGSGSLRLVVVQESEQGRDLDGDGDATDGVVHVVDLAHGSVVDTGLALGVPSVFLTRPMPFAAAGETLAFGVNERETGGLDRNADGDADDFVLALWERDGARVTNLGLAVVFLLANEDVLAFGVPELAQGEDLDGDGSVTSLVPFVHDFRTGETWNTGLRGSEVLDVQGDFVALAVFEQVVGDRNGDGDSIDSVFELYDASTRTVQQVGLTMGIFGDRSSVIARRGHWALNVSEANQGADLDGDGDAFDRVVVVYEPRTRTTRTLGQFFAWSRPRVEPLVLFEPETLPGSSPAPVVWLYDVDLDLLVSTALRGIDVQSIGTRLVLRVPEPDQGEDLDRNGAQDSIVPVLYDLASGRTESLGIDARGVEPFQGGLLLRAREHLSRRDWNGDGDREDDVLFSWDERTGLSNTRLDSLNAVPVPLGNEFALVVVNEARNAVDRNGDNDRNDHAIEAYDLSTRRFTSLGLMGSFLLEDAGNMGLFPVMEAEQGQDLNGDGDQTDLVLHQAEVLFLALRPESGQG